MSDVGRGDLRGRFEPVPARCSICEAEAGLENITREKHCEGLESRRLGFVASARICKHRRGIPHPECGFGMTALMLSRS